MIEKRTDKSAIGFDAPVKSKQKRDVGTLFSQVEPHDLLKFGIIPELVGRMPVITSLQSLTCDDLVRILVEPKNALTKQYEALLAMDGVTLEIQPEALKIIAQKALDRQIGARGLRAIMEKVMTKVMFVIPSDLSIKKVIITPESIEGGNASILRDPAHPRESLMNKR
jgi:ATP-dependent Clp protease ATP-binding subunit ClpX